MNTSSELPTNTCTCTLAYVQCKCSVNASCCSLFFSSHILFSLEGAYFHLSDSPDPDIEYFCKLSIDHRQIVISNDHLSIDMKQILEVKTLHGDGREREMSWC